MPVRENPRGRDSLADRRVALPIRSTRYAFVALLCACVGASFARPARADDAVGEAAEKYARELFEKADVAMRNTPPDYDAACDGFKKAYEIAHGLGALKKQAVCEEARGKLATALALWKQAALEPQAPDRKAESEKQVANLEAKVGRLLVEAPSAGVTVSVDGGAWPVGAPAPIDAGAHRVLFEGKDGEGHATARTVEITVTNGATATAREPESGSGEKPHRDPDGERPSSAPGDSRTGMRVAGIVVAGLGAVGLVTFGVTGGLVLAAKSDLEDACVNHDAEPFSGCNADAPGIVSRGDTFNAVNAVSLGVGVVALGVAVPLLVVGFNGSPAKKEPAKKEPGATAVVVPWIQRDSAGLVVLGGF